MSTGIQTLSSATINGLTSLSLSSLSTDTLSSNEISGTNFFIDIIETNDIQIDNEMELTTNGFIVIGKNSPGQIIITDTEVGYLDGLASNIQEQIDAFDVDISGLQTSITNNTTNITANGTSITALQTKTQYLDLQLIDGRYYFYSPYIDLVLQTFNAIIFLRGSRVELGSDANSRTQVYGGIELNGALQISAFTEVIRNQINNNQTFMYDEIYAANVNINNLIDKTVYMSVNVGLIKTSFQNNLEVVGQFTLNSGLQRIINSAGNMYIQCDNDIIFSKKFTANANNVKINTTSGQLNCQTLQINNINSLAFETTDKTQISTNASYISILNQKTQHLTSTASITSIGTELFCVDDLQLNNGQTRFTYAGGQSYFQSAGWVRFSQLYNATTNDFFVSTTTGNVYINGILYINYIQSFPYSSTEKAQVAQNTADIVVLKYLKTFETKFYFDARILGINASYTIPAGTYNLSDYDYKIGYNDFPGLFHPTTNLWTGGSKRIKVTYSMSQNLLTNTDLTVWKSQVYKKNISTGARNPRSLYIGPHYAVSNRLNKYIQNECSVVMHIVNGEQIYISTTFQAIVNSTLSVEIENKIEIVEL